MLIPIRVRLCALAGAVLAGCGVLCADPDDLLHATSEPLDVFGIGSGRLQPAQQPPVIFGVIGDYGTGSLWEGAVVAMIGDWAPDFVVTAGDNNYGSLEPDPNKFVPPRTAWSILVGDYFGSFIKGRDDGLYPEQQSVNQRFYPSVGNHDSAPVEDEMAYSGGNGGTIRGYLAYFHDNPGGMPRLPTDRGAVHNLDVSYYAVRRGPVDLFILDADAIHAADLIDQQKQWLLDRLEESDAPWKIAVFHQPPYTSSFRGGTPWMTWNELGDLSAMLCGHDHFYERLDYTEDGPPMFINGAGGGSLYGFTTPDPRSRFRFNSQPGAMRVSADPSGIVFEFRAVNLSGGSEDIIERYVLGSPIENDPHDDFTFFGEGGLTLHVATLTPDPEENPLLDPAIELYSPSRNLIAQSSDGAPDGRNAALTHSLSEDGRYRVRVKTETAGAGSYQLHARFEHPRGGYPEWRALHFPDGGAVGDPEADADGDGLRNILEYALGSRPDNSSGVDTEPLRAGFPGGSALAEVIEIAFELAAPLPLDVNCHLEMSTDLASGQWFVVAYKPLFGGWASAAEVVVARTGPQHQRVAVLIPVNDGAARRFFRLRVTQNNSP
jgi:hypothetical protein